jgi:hypothetical protein
MNKITKILETPIQGESLHNLLSLDVPIALLQSKIDEAMEVEVSDFKTSLKLGKSLTTCLNQQKRCQEVVLCHRIVGTEIMDAFIAGVVEFEPRFSVENHRPTILKKLPGGDHCDLTLAVVKSRRMFHKIVESEDCDAQLLCSCVTFLVGAVKALQRGHENAPGVMTRAQVNAFIGDAVHLAGQILCESYGFDDHIYSKNQSGNVLAPALIRCCQTLYGDDDGELENDLQTTLNQIGGNNA